MYVGTTIEEAPTATPTRIRKTMNSAMVGASAVAIAPTV
jgi:hypothetical protein